MVDVERGHDLVFVLASCRGLPIDGSVELALVMISGSTWMKVHKHYLLAKLLELSFFLKWCSYYDEKKIKTFLVMAT